MLAAVYANPTNLELRAVYGDWLLQHGDPRGELISLQLGPSSPAGEARIKKLIAAHWKTWLGPISEWFNDNYRARKALPEFVAGFPAIGNIVARPEQRTSSGLLEAMSRPEWRTLERLTAWPRSLVPLTMMSTHPGFANVHSLAFELQIEDLEPLLETKPHLQELKIGGLRGGSAPLLERFESLRQLTIGAGDVLKFSRVISQLETLRLTAPTELDEGAARYIERSSVRTLHIGQAVLTRASDEATFTHVDLPLATSDETRRKLRLFSGVSVTTMPSLPRLRCHISGELFDAALFTKLFEILTNGFGARFDAYRWRQEVALGVEPLRKLRTLIARRPRAF